MKTRFANFIKKILLIGLGIISAGFGLKGFLLPNQFIDGGVTGISMLTAKFAPLSLPILLILINIPFLVLSLKQIGKSFTISSVLAIIGLAFAVAFFPYPTITSDKLLVAAFLGAFF